MCSHSHFHGVVLPPSLPTHCSERTCAPTHTSMVSSYHQVYSLTALRELVLPLTLPWCRTTTKSSHTHTNPCAPTHSHLPCPHTLCSPHFISPHSRYKCITNASTMHPNYLPHSPTHHASITSSSPHHLFLSPTTTNRFLSLHTIHSTPFYHSQPSQSSPKSSPISIHTHSLPRRTP